VISLARKTSMENRTIGYSTMEYQLVPKSEIGKARALVDR